MNVTKRSGEKVQFDKEKIRIAVLKAFLEVDKEEMPYAKEKAREIANYVESLNKDLEVEEIQDIVVNKLMSSARKDVAAKYVEYRYRRKLVRESNTTDKTILELIDGTNDYWNNENSNKNAKLVTTQRDYMAGIVSEDISRRFLLPPDVVEAHDQGIIHFHDIDYFGQRTMYNCFSGSTKFITSDGVKRFNEFYDGDKVKVLDMNGVWRDAIVHTYGKQKMYDVTISTQKTSHKITCTSNHRWILKDGRATTNLKVGDTLYPLSNTTQYKPKTSNDYKWFCFGFVLGDGVDRYNDNDEFCGVEARLCKDKNKLLPYFIKAGYSKREKTLNNDNFIFNKKSFSKQVFLSNHCWRLLDLDSKIALFHGYYEADGFKNRNGIATSDERLSLMIEEISALSGYHITSKRDEIRNTNYKENARLITFRFVIEQPNNWLWKVKSIEPHFEYEYDQSNSLNKEITAWCVEEPITHSFTLSGGIVTGNCCLINLEDMLQNGTVISGTMIEKPHSFSTACNIATQIIAQVASSQYGGQSISLSHLAPFVDVSRKKIRAEVDYELNLAHGTFDKDYGDIRDAIVEKRVKEEIKRGVQTIQYQVVTLMTTNGQAPFLSVFMYLNEVKDKQTKNDLALIIEEVLRQRIQGVKNEKGVWVTPAFPKLLYVLEDDNTYEGSKYYYLTKLAAECSAKRLVPDYISEKKMLEYKVDVNGNGNCFPCINKTCA